MRVCGVDLETTWTSPVDANKARIVEIGAVIFDEDWFPRAEFSCFVWDEAYRPLGPEIEKLNGLTDAVVSKDGIPLFDALIKLAHFQGDSEFFVAHNKGFDETVLKAECDRASVDPKSLPPFICTVFDVPHLADKGCKKLSHLALDYGVAVDPSGLHRAVNDVQLMGKMMKASGFKVQGIVEFMKIPWVYIEAVIPVPWKDGGKGKDLAKARGFRWEKFHYQEPEFPKKWVKKIKQNALEAEIKSLPFPVVIL